MTRLQLGPVLALLLVNQAQSQRPWSVARNTTFRTFSECVPSLKMPQRLQALERVQSQHVQTPTSITWVGCTPLSRLLLLPPSLQPKHRHRPSSQWVTEPYSLLVAALRPAPDHILWSPRAFGLTNPTPPRNHIEQAMTVATGDKR